MKARPVSLTPFTYRRRIPSSSTEDREKPREIPNHVVRKHQATPAFPHNNMHYREGSAMPVPDTVVTNFSFLPFLKPLQMPKTEKASLRKKRISKLIHKSFTVLFKYTTAAKRWNTLQVPFSKVISRSLLFADKTCAELWFVSQTNKSQEADGYG